MSGNGVIESGRHAGLSLLEAPSTTETIESWAGTVNSKLPPTAGPEKICPDLVEALPVGLAPMRSCNPLSAGLPHILGGRK